MRLYHNSSGNCKPVIAEDRGEVHPKQFSIFKGEGALRTFALCLSPVTSQTGCSCM